MEQQGIKILPTVFIDKTTNLDLKNSCHPIGTKRFKTCLSAGSYLTEVFEAADIAKLAPNIKP
jgi:hypothetical protein